MWAGLRAERLSRERLHKDQNGVVGELACNPPSLSEVGDDRGREVWA